MHDVLVEQEETNEFEHELQKDAMAQEAYVANVYSRRVPPPLPPTKDELSFWKIAGIEAVIFTLVSFGSVIFSSIRTGGLFYILETLLLKKFDIASGFGYFMGITAMVTALLMFEGLLAGDGFKKGKNNLDIETSDIGVWAALIVIILAGVFAGMGLLTLPEEVENWFYIGLALITAVATSFFTYSFFARV